jgi:hypothetical protein
LKVKISLQITFLSRLELALEEQVLEVLVQVLEVSAQGLLLWVLDSHIQLLLRRQV